MADTCFKHKTRDFLGKVVSKSLLGLGLLVFILVVLVPLGQAETGEWTVCTVANYFGNYGEAITGAGNFIYLIRGDPTNSHFQRYNTSTDQWEACTQPGIKCRAGTVPAWGNGDYIYVLMGNSDNTTYHYFYRYSISGNSWVALVDTLNEQGEGDAGGIFSSISFYLRSIRASKRIECLDSG